jgi:hypothetical protein
MSEMTSLSFCSQEEHLIRGFDFSGLEAAWQATDKAAAIDAAAARQAADISKISAAHAAVTAGFAKLDAAAARQAADISKISAALGQIALPSHLVDMVNAASAGAKFVPIGGTIASAIRQLVRPEDAIALYMQVLDTVRPHPSIDSLLMEGSRRPTFTPTDAADAEGNSPAMDEKPAAAQTAARAWIVWVRRYNTELLLLVSVLLLLAAAIQIVLTLNAQAALTPSHPDPAVTPLRHGTLSVGSQKLSRDELQPERCSPSSSPAVGPVRLPSRDGKDLHQSR